MNMSVPAAGTGTMVPSSFRVVGPENLNKSPQRKIVGVPMAVDCTGVNITQICNTLKSIMVYDSQKNTLTVSEYMITFAPIPLD